MRVALVRRKNRLQLTLCKICPNIHEGEKMQKFQNFSARLGLGLGLVGLGIGWTDIEFRP